MRDVISSDGLSALVKKGDKLQHALLLLVEMILNDLLPKVLSYNSAISTCIPSGQRQHALGLLWKKRNKGSFPDVITFSFAINVCEKGENGSVYWNCSLRRDAVICCPTTCYQRL